MARIPTTSDPRAVLLDRAGRSLANDVGYAARLGIVRGVEAATGRAGVFMESMADALKKDRINRSILRNTNERLAEQARRAVISQYKSRTPRRRQAPYRTEARIGYGLTLAALKDGGHADASGPFRIVPFDFDLLDQLTSFGGEGALWRQLNYGALPASGKAPAAFGITLPGGGTIAYAPTNHPVPAGVLKRPANAFWRNESGQRMGNNPRGDDIFQPTKGAASGPMIPLQGSRATQFMDAASRSIAENLPAAYTAMYRDLLNDAGQRARLKAAGVKVPQRLGALKQPQFSRVRVRTT